MSLKLSEVDDNMQQNASILSMQAELRQAMFNAISIDDVAAIMKTQVEKAKKGDPKALKFVMDYALGHATPVTLNQYNIVDTETAARAAREASSRKRLG